MSFPKYVAAMLLVFVLAGCKSAGDNAINRTDTVTTARQGTGTSKRQSIPKAKIYTVSPEYSDKVGVRMDAGKTRLISFPAPTDITASTAPVELYGGYYLDRQGIDINTMFLEWSRSEYAGKGKTPTKGEIQEAILPMSFVETLIELPFTVQDAMADTAAVNNLIKNNFPGCKILRGSRLQVGQPEIIIGTDY